MDSWEEKHGSELSKNMRTSKIQDKPSNSRRITLNRRAVDDLKPTTHATAVSPSLVSDSVRWRSSGNSSWRTNIQSALLIRNVWSLRHISSGLQMRKKSYIYHDVKRTNEVGLSTEKGSSLTLIPRHPRETPVRRYYLRPSLRSTDSVLRSIQKNRSLIRTGHKDTHSTDTTEHREHASLAFLDLITQV